MKHGEEGSRSCSSAIIEESRISHRGACMPCVCVCVLFLEERRHRQYDSQVKAWVCKQEQVVMVRELTPDY